MDAFISYSHRDAEALDRLHVHLANLRREGLIEAWYDRDILAGDNLDREIEKRLEASGLFLLLVTPDFLNSDYCVEREMARALERQANGEARVIAIITQPCEWKSTKLRALKVVPNDGRAISEWTNPNSAYLDVVQEIRRAIESDVVSSVTDQIADAPHTPLGVQRRYRAKRDFDDIDKGEFREAAFAAIRDYFRAAAAELDSLDDFRGRFRELSATSFGCTIVNRARDRGTAHTIVRMRSGSRFAFGDISYSYGEDAAENTANGSFSIGNDEFELFLKGSSFSFGGERDNERLSPQLVAEKLWEDLLQRAGIAYE